jgi:hypothetical protein
VTLVVQRIIGRAAIIDPVRGRVYAIGSGFEMPPSGQHRATYSFVQAQEVADWLNGNDRPLNIVARAVDPFDPLNRRALNARKGLAPLPDKE